MIIYIYECSYEHFCLGLDRITLCLRHNIDQVETAARQCSNEEVLQRVQFVRETSLAAS